MLINKTVSEFVDSVASKDPAPGGGSVSALGSSLGAALTSMVGNLTIGRKAYKALDEDKRQKLDENFKKVNELIGRLNVLIDEDTNAFNGVMAALKMPKETEEEKKARTAAIQEATKEALEIPLSAAKTSLEVLRKQKIFAEYGNKNAITDIGVGALLAYAGLEGALFNVLINLKSLKDEEYVAKIRKETDDILNEGNKIKEEVLKIVYSKL